MAEPLWTSDELLAATGGQLHGAAFDVEGVNFDSRAITSGDLFAALKGERDGHAFTPTAFERGAAGALVSQPVDGPHIQVADTLKGLERLGAAARDRSSALRGAVTGSVGKTSVTQAVKAGLELAGRAHGAVKSFNNHIGVPLTLARMPQDTERAVFEIGMNHAGEIDPLSRLVQPHAVVVTTVGAVHTENFPDGEAGVARAKAEIFGGLKPGGAAILNADNRWFDFLKDEAEAHGGRVASFGSAEASDAQLLDFAGDETGATVRARLHGREISYRLLQSGVHWGPNSLAVLLMLEALGVGLDTSLEALAGFAPLQGRGAERVVQGPRGAFTLIDESYNANPLSMRAAITTLSCRKTAGRRVVALTDMLELGDDAAEQHAAIGQALTESGIDLVFCAGPLMKALWDALPPALRGGYGLAASEVAPEVAAAVRAGDVVMVKGSNGSKAGAIAIALGALDTGRRGRLMFYYFYLLATEHHHYIPLLNLMKYITFRTGLSLFTAQIVCVGMGSRFIRWIRARQGKGQPIRSDGPQSHIIEKAGTPTMGGFMILAGLLVGTLLFGDLTNPYVWTVLLVTGGYGVLGFLDDYRKVTKQTSAGVSGSLKLLIQFSIAVVAAWIMTSAMQHQLTIPGANPTLEPATFAHSVAFPVAKSFLLNLGIVYLLFAAVVIVGASNAVNLTDGLDGLAIVPVMIAAGAFGVIAYLVGNAVFANYLQLHFVQGAGELLIVCGAIIGSGLGFLWYNAPPAKIFMGDTGSLALGGTLGTIAVATKHEIVLAIVGGLFVVEAVSVMLQIAYFKLTGKRIFLMAPIHHHFEKLGWRESTVVIRFWIVAVVLALVGLATLKLR